MALQNVTRVVMTGLGVQDNDPPNSIQPVLPNGVHLRYTTAQSRGFPWHGFFLFRRPHLNGTPVCLSAGLGSLVAGPLPVNFLQTTNGDVSSDVNLVITEAFPPAGTREFDLSGRQYVQVGIPGGQLARRAVVTVGFNDVPGTPVVPVLVDFRERPNATLDNPYTELGGIFTADSGASPAANNFIVQASTDGGSVSGLDCQTKMRIDLPRPSSFAEVSVTTIGIKTAVAAFGPGGNLLGRITISVVNHQTTVRFTQGPVGWVTITPVSGGSAVLHTASYERAATLPTVPVTALLGGVPVRQATLSGDPGKTASLQLQFDAIDAVRVGTVSGALVDLCHVTVASDAATGWAAVPNFPAAMRLPVTSPNYPAGAAAENLANAETLALSRVLYGPSAYWSGIHFQALHDRLLIPLVQDGPFGTPMVERSLVVEADPPDENAPKMTAQKPLDFVLLGSLNPAVAQMLGLYWVDSTVTAADPTTYDYMVVADYTGAGGLSFATVLSLIQAADFQNIDAWISYDLRPGPVPAATPPQNVRVYALPGTTRRSADGLSIEDGNNNAGLFWDLMHSGGALLPGAPIMFHVWRADLGNPPLPTVPPVPPPPNYVLRTVGRPILISKQNGSNPQRSGSWPPFRLHLIDHALAEGWYAYQVTGIDIFGLHSANSSPAAWYQWAPAPEPPPWYYLAGQGDVAVQPYAVQLLNKIPPPSPAAVEATALDPDDPLLFRDTVYMAWFAGLSPAEKTSVIGLRVSWKWTPAQQAQSQSGTVPLEFRIYYQPGKLNSRGGRVTSVTPANATDTDVETDITSTAPAGGYVGGSLRIGSKSFLILSSDPGTPLRVRVRNVGPVNDELPETDRPCTIAIPEVLSLGTASVTQGSAAVTGSGTAWTTALIGQHFQLIGNLTRYKVTAVSSPTQLTLDRTYEGISMSSQGYAIEGPLFTDFGEPTAWQERYYVVDYNSFVTVEVDGTRSYEVILPASGDTIRFGLERPGRAFVPSAAEPIVYGHVGVSASDKRDHTDDDPKWATGDYGNRDGNEGRVGAPAAIYRVLRTPPAAPVGFAEPERVYASEADYHSESFFSFRWRWEPNLKVHVSRALDDALFRTDWALRPRTVDPTIDHFPSEAIDPRWDSNKRDAIIAELDTLNTGGPTFPAALYSALSDDAQRILAGLPGNEAAFTQLTLQPLDPEDPATLDRPGPDTEPGYMPDTAKRIYIDTLDGRASNHYFYRAVFQDGAGNVSPLSLAGAPVYLRKVVPPRTPVITKVLGGDRLITLRWAQNRESDLAAFRVYRADTAEAARDIRLMTKIHDDPIVPEIVDPFEVVFTDDDPPYEIDRYYVVTAVDTAGNESPPTPSVIGRAYDDTHPDPPVWNPAVPGPSGSLVLSWTASEPALSCLVQRSGAGLNQWTPISGWLPRGASAFLDKTRAPVTIYDYRLRVIDQQGHQNTSFSVLTE